MTLRMTILSGAAMAVVISTVRCLWLVLRRWSRPTDSDIDALIAANRPQSLSRKRPEWQGIDWAKLDRAGERRWQQALRGQRKTRGTSIGEVRSFKAR